MGCGEVGGRSFGGGPLQGPFVVACLAVVWGLLWSASPLAAQAWVPAKRAGTVSAGFQASEFYGHLESDGRKFHGGDSYSRVLFVEVDYGLTDRLAFTASVPYVWARNGRDPSPVAGFTGVDDGHYHGTLQDYRFTLRYRALADPLVLTPFVRYVLPSHHYETRAEAAPGRDLEEWIVGVDVGRVLFSRQYPTYVHLSLGYAFVEELVGVSTDRLNAGLVVGYFVTPGLSVNARGVLQNTYGGLSVDHVFGPHVSDEEFLEHDRLLADDSERAGLGAGYAFGPRWSIDVAWLTVVGGSDTHYGDTYAIAVHRSFGN